MTSRFSRAKDLRRMTRSIRHDPDLGKGDEANVIMYLQQAINILDPPVCGAWGPGGNCYEPAPDGTLYCGRHQKNPEARPQ